MNNIEADSSGLFGSNDISEFVYGIGISIWIVLLITTITLTFYLYTRSHVTTNDLGLNEETIMSYPKMLYSEVKLRKYDSTSICCSICLGDYKGSDMLKVLPNCEHLFHLKCIDPWLRMHPTCPLCRTSLITTPLAEIVPLATRRDSSYIGSLIFILFLQIASLVVYHKFIY
jgi:hypothetical protein